MSEQMDLLAAVKIVADMYDAIIKRAAEETGETLRLWADLSINEQVVIHRAFIRPIQTLVEVGRAKR
jgi:hypothetical protein